MASSEGVMVVEVGQVWASNDRRDREANHNQRRRVVAVDSRYAELTRGIHSGTTRVLLGGSGIRGHRLVREGDGDQ